MGKGRNRVIMKKIGPSKEEQDDLNSLFNQITGLNLANPEVLAPKIAKIYCNIMKYIKLFNILISFDDFKNTFSNYSFWFDEIKAFIEVLESSTNYDHTKNYKDEFIMQIELAKLSAEEINEMYKNIKNNVSIKKIIITGSTLSSYKKYLVTDHLDDSFIKKEPGINFQPIAFSSIDLKLMWVSDSLSAKAKQFMLSILCHAMNIGIELYEIVTSPDVNIQHFSSALISKFTHLRKVIPRCDKAFDILENSVKLLEDKFSTYYRDSIESENPSVIMENFLIDVSTTQSADPVVTGQFRTIINYLKQQASNNTDPKVKRLFGIINSQFNSLSNETNIQVKEDETEEKPLETISLDESDDDYEIICDEK